MYVNHDETLIKYSNLNSHLNDKSTEIIGLKLSFLEEILFSGLTNNAVAGELLGRGGFHKKNTKKKQKKKKQKKNKQTVIYLRKTLRTGVHIGHR